MHSMPLGGNTPTRATLTQHAPITMEHNTTYSVLRYAIALLLPLLATAAFAEQHRFRNINSNHGLSSNSVNAICKDSHGFLWIGTNQGLNRYDGYQIKTFRINPTDKNSIANNYIYSIDEDADSLLWISTRSGYSVFNPHNERFYNDYTSILGKRGIDNGKIRFFTAERNLSAYILNNYSVVVYNHENKLTTPVKVSGKTQFIHGKFDSKRYLWLLDKHLALYKINPDTGEVVDGSDYLTGKSGTQGRIFIDSRNNVWVICSNKYLVHYNTATNQWREFPSERFGQFSIRDITQNGTDICIGTDHGGLFLININTFAIDNITQQDEEYTLSDNTVSSLYSDSDGILWVGTYKHGVDYYHPSFNSFYTYRINASSLLNDVNCFAEDRNGVLWIGTNGNGLYRKEQEKYVRIPYHPQTHSNGTVVALFPDSRGRMWVGTFMDGLYCYENNHFIHFTERDGIDNSVWCIGEDADGCIWIGTLNRGIYRFDNESKRFIASQHNVKDQSVTIECIFRKDRELWFGTSNGIVILSTRDKILRHFKFTKVNDITPEKNYINQITQDAKGYYWICTQGGLAVVDNNMKNYHFFTEKEGIEQNSVYMAIVDKQNDIWISTPKGLFRIQVTNYGNLSDIQIRISKYGKEDGLQDNIFNAKAGLLTRENHVIFGGVNGYNKFNPSEIVRKEQIARLLFTELYVNNQLIKAGEETNGRLLLERSLTESKSITLKHNENNIRINFSALNLLYPLKYKYEYRLEGLETDWRSTQETVPYASYSNLPAGNYQLHVRAIDQSGTGYVQNTGMHIHVLPPFWFSWQAYLIYGILLSIMVYYIIRNIMLRTALKYKIQQQQLEQKHLEEMNNMKINFFTNLSHELRTPVSLIILPIENLLVQEKSWAIKNNLNMVLRNAKRLLFLVNQLLDFRKLEAGETSYNPMMGDLVSYVRNATTAFADMSQSKDIKLSFVSNVEELYTLFDPSKMERIVFNLLSNAFKFTPHGGHIGVSVAYDKEAPLPIRIEVTDTGIGIEQKELENIFKPFYQVESNGRTINIGTGIGLAVIHDFVALHRGEIHVESEVGKGSAFIIELPLDSGESPAKNIEPAETSIQPHPTGSATTATFSPKAHTVLIVDDNEDFRLYLVENLRNSYNILEAENGETAFEKACKHLPDLILSDVMMPVVDGLQLCERLKEKSQTARIPVILLTASVLEQHNIKGLELGIDTFLTKPFNLEVLKAQIANLLKRKETEQETAPNANEKAITDVKPSSLDEKLLNKVIGITHEHLSDSSFGIEQLSREIGISSVYLNKKISALTGKTSSEYVRSIRIKRGAALLAKTQLSISEIAYEVGYTDPKYFSKYFKEEYGMLPSEYRKSYK